MKLEKSFNKRLGIACFRTKREWKKIDEKTMALTLVLLTAFVAVIVGLTASSIVAETTSTLDATTAEATVTTLAAETESTITDTSSVTTTVAENQTGELPFWGMGELMMGDPGFGGGHGCHGLGGMGSIEVSSEYTATVNAILDSDADVQNLIAVGYNVASINPIIKAVIEVDGTVATKATTATVTLQNGTSGYATVSVDIEQAKVTQIIILTRTVIDKTTS